MSQQCLECSKTFSRQQALKRHNLRFHSSKPQAKIGRPTKDIRDLVKYQCLVCSKDFNHLGKFKSHQATHRPDIRWMCWLPKTKVLVESKLALAKEVKIKIPSVKKEKSIIPS